MEDRPIIRVLLADDHAIVRDGIRSVLKKAGDIEVVGEAEDGKQAIDMAMELRPDVILCDVRLPRINGIEVVENLKKEYSPFPKILILSAFDDDEYIFDSIAAGASGYLLKTMDSREIADAVRRAYSGQTILYPPVSEILARALVGNTRSVRRESLSSREKEILTQAAQGMTNKQIAENLDISVRTVDGHFSRILAKLSVSSRFEAIKTGLSAKLIDLGKVA